MLTFILIAVVLVVVYFVVKSRARKSREEFQSREGVHKVTIKRPRK